MRMTIGSRSWPLRESVQLVSMEKAIHRYSRFCVSFRFGLGKATVAACSIQIDVRVPQGYIEH
jgi:hypothetical protein